MFTGQRLPTLFEVTEESLDQDDVSVQELTASDDDEVLMFASLNISGNESPRFDYTEKMFATSASHPIFSPIEVARNFGIQIEEMDPRDSTPMPELTSPSPLTVGSTSSPESFSSEEESTEDQPQSALEFNQGIQKSEQALLLSAPFSHVFSPSHFLYNRLKEGGKEQVLEKKYKAISYYQPIAEQESGLSYEAIKRAKIR